VTSLARPGQVGHRLELLALAGVVVTLPFHLFTWSVGGQSVSPTEAAVALAAALIGARRIVGRRDLTLPARPSGAGRRAPSPPSPHPIPLPGGEGRTAPSPPGRGVGGEGQQSWGAFDGPIILFLTAALLSLLATEYLRLSLRELRTLIVEPVLFWYLCRAVLRSPGEAGWLVVALVGATAVAAVVGLAQLVVGGAVTDVQGVRRVLGTYTSPNHFALLLGRVLPFAIAGGWLLSRWRPWAIAAGALCAGALLATFSVGGWLGTGLAVLVVVGLVGGRRALLGLVLAGAVAAAVLLFAAPVERLAGRLDPRQGTSFVRVQLWQAAIELIAQSPLLGIGLDNFLYRYPSLMPPDTAFEPNLSHPHNLLLQFWLQLGLPGLVALGWLLWRFVRLAWPRAQAAIGLPLDRALAVGALGSMTDFVAHGLVDNSYFLADMAIVFWLTLAVAAAVGRENPASTLTPAAPVQGKRELPSSRRAGEGAGSDAVGR
jgi:O-antigen ligase